MPLRWTRTHSPVACLQGSGGTVDPASLSGGNAQAATSAVQQGVQGEAEWNGSRVLRLMLQAALVLAVGFELQTA